MLKAFFRMSRLAVVTLLISLYLTGVGCAASSAPAHDTIVPDLAQKILSLAYPKDKKSPLQWGEAYAAVKAQEKGVLEEEIDGNLLGYRIQQGDSSIYMVYVFDGNGLLAEVDFFLNYSRQDSRQYVTDYHTLVAYFTARFGKASGTQTVYPEGADEESVRNRPLAEVYESGEAKTVTTWDIDEKTRAVATIGGEEAGVTLAAMFSKKE